MNKPHRLSGREGRGTGIETPKLVRCAIYTRKSTEEGLQQEFNSLDAQRESAEAYIKSQAHEGWVCLERNYDDGGFTGGNMERPGLKSLLADIEAGLVDCVIVYKVDRLSRSLLDFARMLEIFERHKVAFVSVTQQFNTANSMGRLMLNVLLSFAQFERELVSERTRDKIAATRRKGKWSGGIPILGYDNDSSGCGKLVVNETEAERVRAIFRLYLEHKSLIGLAAELDRRGWHNKGWTTRKGRATGGKPFDKSGLRRLLTNVTYAGKIRYKREVHNGQHEGIVPPELFEGVQELLSHSKSHYGAVAKNKTGSILKGLLLCGSCGTAMTPACSTKGKTRRYRYYVCTQAQKRGWHVCPTKSVPAAQIELFVVERIRSIGEDPELVRETIKQMAVVASEEAAGLRAELAGSQREMGRLNEELSRTALASTGGTQSELATARMADLQERIFTVQRRMLEVHEELGRYQHQELDEDWATEALAQFGPVWDSLEPRERAELLQLLIERVVYDAAEGNIQITFRASGIRGLGDQQVEGEANQ